MRSSVTPTRVMIYVQHLLGTGHLRRMSVIAKTLSGNNVSTNLVSGGMPLPDLDIGNANLVQLTPMQSKDIAFSAYVDDQGRVIDEQWKSARREQLLDVFAKTRPDVLMIEAFPFARRQLRFELLPLLDYARAASWSPKIVCSIRDILQEKKDLTKNQQTVDLVKKYFSTILVHADPEFVELADSFALTKEIADHIQYTGFVVAEAQSDVDPKIHYPGIGKDEVVVSAGGGAAAGELYKTALAAAREPKANALSWRLLVGYGVRQQIFNELKRGAPDNVSVERPCPDFRAVLKRCAVSVSQAGYNTAMDLFTTRTPAVLVPFAGEGETEQTLRAEKFSEMGAAIVVQESDLTANNLADAVLNAKNLQVPEYAMNLDGAGQCLQLVRRWLN